ncbi:hypothetical protein [Nonomuraea sp. KM90]|uniref:hypothetical protein n=1 Tax=Nonomuraea sp. KM90 TaxID=3457428 RepID=UPI003FCCC08B
MTTSTSAPSTLAPVPGKAGQQLILPGTGANTEEAHRLSRRLGNTAMFAHDNALTRAGDGYFTWLDHIWPAAGCTAPIRLHGQVH